MIEEKPVSSFLLGRLDESTRLIATPTAFVIQERKMQEEKEAWTSKFYYGEIGDAIRGYVRSTLRNPKRTAQLDGKINSLISSIENLEKTVKEVAVNIKAEWDVRLQDPIESHLACLRKIRCLK